jgi:hypothetical protein
LERINARVSNGAIYMEWNTLGIAKQELWNNMVNDEDRILFIQENVFVFEA